MISMNDETRYKMLASLKEKFISAIVEVEQEFGDEIDYLILMEAANQAGREAEFQCQTLSL